MTEVRPHTAWEEARVGYVGRLVDVYVRTIIRCRERGLLPKAIEYGLRDALAGEAGSRSMVVGHSAIDGSHFFIARLFAPSRDDGDFGFTIKPPPHFKAGLRAFMVTAKKDHKGTVH